MTDGIIQEMFADFLARNYFKSDKGLVVSVEQVTAFKQELIEKIKKECFNTGLFRRWISKEVLIGDNE